VDSLGSTRSREEAGAQLWEDLGIRQSSLDTYYVRTYTVFMNITLSIDEQLVERAREKLRATGKTVNQEIREHLEHIVGDDELEQALEFFEKTSGLGKSEPGWKWNRDEIYEDRIKWPRK
jgi:hypothetical protein